MLLARNPTARAVTSGRWDPGASEARRARSARTRDGLANEIGTVEVGKRADLVIVRKDPLRNLRALRAIRWTIKDGVAHTPAEWLSS